ncbi:MAG: flagellar hook protein FlgE [Nitrospirae bacterium]|nr:flagellar hook protein FlgE [Nitrospirota bacterium]
MTILTSLFSGVSGLNANGSAISIIGNNIANMNTTGFKASTATFADVIGQDLAGSSGSSQIGRGVFLSSVNPTFTQGSFETTSSALDLAIDGNGFYEVKDSSGGTFYTRAGNFDMDKDGNIVNPEGLILQGYQVDSAGNITGTIDDLTISSSTSPPRATTDAEIAANLDSSSTIPAAFDVTDPTSTSNFSTAMTVYDSLGNGHLTTVYFRKSAEAATGNTWEWYAVVDGSELTGGVTAIQAQGTIDFDTTGAMNTVATTLSDFDFSGGATQSQAITFDFGSTIAGGGTGLDGTTQFASTSATVSQNQDGYSSGALQGFSIDQEGMITGLFTNGQTRVLGQVVLATFSSPDGLTQMGSNLYAESFESGQPIVGAPNTAGRGSIQANSLELSNVDLGSEFINLITAQRGFQANSRIITTTDDILGELVNLKR